MIRALVDVTGQPGGDLLSHDCDGNTSLGSVLVEGWDRAFMHQVKAVRAHPLFNHSAPSVCMTPNFLRSFFCLIGAPLVRPSQLLNHPQVRL